MADYYNPDPALIISPSRNGGTFLAHCLDSHYQIRCNRDEPFSEQRYWQALGISNKDLATALWQEAGYRVAMFRVTYRQMRHEKLPIYLLNEVRPKIIHLHRENVLQTIISSALSTLTASGTINHAIHSYRPVVQQVVKIDCETLVGKIEDQLSKIAVMIESLSSFDLLKLTYEEITGGLISASQIKTDKASKLCTFLNVYRSHLFTELSRVNTSPTITNLSDVIDTLADTDYYWMTKDYADI